MTDPAPATTAATLTISAFAEASRLSIKALRLYDELGLLPPARVDESNGYRYYSPQQLPAAQLISLLRQLGLPLRAIAEMVQATAPGRPELFRQHWATQKAEQARREELAAFILTRLTGENALKDQYDVQTRLVPAQQVACLTYRVNVPELPRIIPEGTHQLEQYVTAQGGTCLQPSFVIYHGEVNTDSDGPIEICQPYSGQLSPAGDVTLRVEPAHHEAFVTLTLAQFSYPRLLHAYDAVSNYAQQHGTCGPLHCREVYPPYDWDNLQPDDPAGDIAWPYTPKEA